MDEWAATSPFFDHLGLTIERNPDNTSTVRVPLATPLTNRKGDVHGGATAAVLDTALSHSVRFGVANLAGTSTISLNINYIAPGRTSLIAHGRLVRAGSTIAFAAGEVFDETGNLIATAQGTFRLIHRRAR
jgi:uncharacterized protein (TIGR00369 family)